MRKIKYLLAVGVMSTSLLFGCGSNDTDDRTDIAMTPDEFIEKVEACDAAEIKSSDFKLSADADLSMSMGTQEENVKGNIDINGSFDENGAIKMSININADDEQKTFDCYCIPENDSYTLYYQMMNMWYKMTLDSIEDMIGESTSNLIDMDAYPLTPDNASLPDFTGVLKMAFDYLKDTSVSTSDNAYVLKGTIDLDKIIGELASEDDEISEITSEYSDIIKDIKLNVSYAINISDNTFKSFEFSIGEFNHEIQGVTVNINSLKIALSTDNYNKVSDITLPDDAANAMDMSELMNGMY